MSLTAMPALHDFMTSYGSFYVAIVYNLFHVLYFSRDVPSKTAQLQLSMLVL